MLVKTKSMESKIRRQKILGEMRKIPEIREILEHELFLSLGAFRHHGSISCLEHSLCVAIKAFEMARGVRADKIATARAALLHDFYLYDWHTDSPGLHGFKHPYIALRNAQKHFALSNIEKDAIKRHMWPLTPIPPRYRESMIVSIADKAATWEDYLGRIKSEDHVLCSEL